MDSLQKLKLELEQQLVATEKKNSDLIKSTTDLTRIANELRTEKNMSQLQIAKLEKTITDHEASTASRLQVKQSELENVKHELNKLRTKNQENQ